MEWEIPTSERAYLRELARKQAEYAALPVMEQRKKMWYDLNDRGAGARPPVVIETWTFDRDFLPDSLLRCQSKTGRGIEKQLLRNIRNHELIDDDKVMPDSFVINWQTTIDEFGVKIPKYSVADAQGVETGYRFDHPIKNLARDLGVLRPASAKVNKERTLAWKQYLENLFNGILPVQLAGGLFFGAMLTHRVVALMGMEAYFTAMYDAPDAVHALMAYLSDNVLRMNRWLEDNGLLIVNNTNQASFGSSYNYTAALPAPGYTAPAARQCDLWGCANSQETVGISPAMFHEFCFPYYRAVAEPMGLLYYGCCEPTHPFWDDLSRLPHLKKISISRWCDEEFMGSALRDTNIVFSRKPDPKFLGIDETLDEEGWTAHIRKSLEATKGVGVEFIVRDVYTVHGNLSKPRRAVELARKEIDRQGRG